MTEPGSPENKNPGKRLEDFMMERTQEFIRMHELASEYMGEKMMLAGAYMEDGFEKMDEKMFGKLELIPNDCKDYETRRNLRMVQWEIKLQVGAFFLKERITNKITSSFLGPAGETVKSGTSKDLEKELDTELKKIIKADRFRLKNLPTTGQRWGYATAALLMFDEGISQNINSTEYKLEMRKALLEGVKKNEKQDTASQYLQIANDVTRINDRDKLVSVLNKYINDPVEA